MRTDLYTWENLIKQTHKYKKPAAKRLMIASNNVYSRR